MTSEELKAETSEGLQELQERDETDPVALAIEEGSPFRPPEGPMLDLGDIDVEFGEDETMIINMGPQHPSTHGVLRIMMELEGEATEALLHIEIPPRATWIRMLMTELNRISSHVLWMATNGMDLASTSMMIYGFRDREMILSFFEKTTGLRMNHDYIRPGGVAADLPDGWEDDVMSIIETIPGRVDEYDEMLTGQPIFKRRTEGVGIISPELAIAMSATGPILRASGVAWDLRRAMPYLAYGDVDFDVIVGTVGDVFDRYAVRLNEIRESCKIVRQCVEKMPLGDYRAQDKKVTPPPRARIDESMEALIHHFKIFTRGFEVPPGEVYTAIESPRGELGCYLVADGSNKPYRMHIRAPSFVNLQSLPPLLRGGLIADAVAVISSVDPVMGEVDR